MYSSDKIGLFCHFTDLGHVGGWCRALMLLDLSAAFDSVDPSILKDVMQRRFIGVCGKSLDWLADFLSDRMQVIHACSRESIAATLMSGVPQGSVLGPKQFIQYAEDVTRLLQMTCKECYMVHRLMFLGSYRPSLTALQMPVTGVPRSACS